MITYLVKFSFQLLQPLNGLAAKGCFILVDGVLRPEGRGSEVGHHHICSRQYSQLTTLRRERCQRRSGGDKCIGMHQSHDGEHQQRKAQISCRLTAQWGVGVGYKGPYAYHLRLDTLHKQQILNQ